MLIVILCPQYTVRNIGGTCDDKNTNTKETTCNPAGECVGAWLNDLCIGKPPCQALSACHAVGECNKANGLCSYPFKKKGSKCNDGDSSTGKRRPINKRFHVLTNQYQLHPTAQTSVDDVCNGEGYCSGVNKCAVVICKPLSDCHVAGKCNKQTGKCSNPKKEKNTKCDDGDFKTGRDCPLK